MYQFRLFKRNMKSQLESGRLRDTFADWKFEQCFELAGRSQKFLECIPAKEFAFAHFPFHFRNREEANAKVLCVGKQSGKSDRIRFIDRQFDHFVHLSIDQKNVFVRLNRVDF
jgi:hypothetical protein